MATSCSNKNQGSRNESEPVRGRNWIVTITANEETAAWQGRLQEYLEKGRLRAYEFAFEVGVVAEAPYPHFHVYVKTSKLQRGRSFILKLLKHPCYVELCRNETAYRQYIRKQQGAPLTQTAANLLPAGAERFRSRGNLGILDPRQTTGAEGYDRRSSMPGTPSPESTSFSGQSHTRLSSSSTIHEASDRNADGLSQRSTTSTTSESAHARSQSLEDADSGTLSQFLFTQQPVSDISSPLDPSATSMPSQPHSLIAPLRPAEKTTSDRRQAAASRGGLLTEAMDNCGSTREALRYIKERNVIMWAMCYNTLKAPLDSHYEELALQRQREEEENSASKRRRRARIDFGLQDFDTELAAQLKTEWEKAKCEDMPLWVYGDPGTGKTAFVKALLGKKAFRLGHTHNVELFRWWDTPYVWADDVNWSLWNIEDVKNFFGHVSEPRMLGVRYKNVTIPENSLKGMIITSNHMPDFYFPRASEIDVRAVNRRLIFFEVRESLFSPQQPHEQTQDRDPSGPSCLKISTPQHEHCSEAEQPTL